MSRRLQGTESPVWLVLADSIMDLGSSRLVPVIEQAYGEGLIDESIMPLEDFREEVRQFGDRIASWAGN